MDLSQLNISELRELIKKASAELDRRRKVDKKTTIEEIKRLAEERGFTLNELFEGQAGGGKRAAKERPVKYRHPEDETKTWSGQGRKPKWVAEWVESGKSMEELSA
jgi:DNA-binding protein H-NS